MVAGNATENKTLYPFVNIVLTPTLNLAVILTGIPLLVLDVLGVLHSGILARWDKVDAEILIQRITPK